MHEMISRSESTSASWVASRLPTDIGNRKDVRVLDIGCWDGYLLSCLPDSWTRAGIEPNHHAAELARCQGIMVIQEPVEAASLPDGQFDLILMLDVLEHLPRPMDVLHKVSHWLAPDGCLFAVTGNGAGRMSRFFRGKWYYLNYPEHVGCFTPESIRYALNNVHLEMESIDAEMHQTGTFRITLRKVVARMSGNSHASDDGLGNPTHRMNSLVLAISRIFRRRDHMVIIARKHEPHT